MLVFLLFVETKADRIRTLCRIDVEHYHFLFSFISFIDRCCVAYPNFVLIEFLFCVIFLIFHSILFFPSFEYCCCGSWHNQPPQKKNTHSISFNSTFGSTWTPQKTMIAPHKLTNPLTTTHDFVLCLYCQCIEQLFQIKSLHFLHCLVLSAFRFVCVCVCVCVNPSLLMTILPRHLICRCLYLFPRQWFFCSLNLKLSIF